MPSFTATAPGKIILFGEHAVVYGRPAIAVPVTQVKARAVVSPNPRGEPGSIHIQAPDIHLDSLLSELPQSHPLSTCVQAVTASLHLRRIPACTLRITSTIPLAAGLGSGAAVSVAIIRSLSAFLGHPLQNDQVCSIAFEVEKLYHGTPSGIDNTVVTYSLPVYFVRDQPIQTFQVPRPFTILIADTGLSSPTAAAVGDVRNAWQANPALYEMLFDAIGGISRKARQAIEAGRPQDLGPMMESNHALLQQVGVSSPEVDHLVDAALAAGALGAKLSGAGRGGNIIALIHSGQAIEISEALKIAGATRTLVTTIQ
jgi:mevalonate kinase